MKRETKVALAFVGLLICSVGMIFSWSTRERVAKIKFSEARLETNGDAVIGYFYTSSAGTCITGKEFENGTNSGEDQNYSVEPGLFGLPDKTYGESALNRSFSDVPSPPPPILVTTGKIYYLKLNDRLRLYDFTNNSGTAYRAELSLAPIR